MSDAYRIPARTSIGHVHLRVADLDRALGFYEGVLGFEVTQRLGRQAAFLSAAHTEQHIEQTLAAAREALAVIAAG